ncbi:hypothetical protein CR513_61939, partial [Mucuna pruriens]
MKISKVLESFFSKRAYAFTKIVRIILDEHWTSTNFQNKSLIVKTNRVIDKGTSTYCGGFISTLAYYENMLPSAWEVTEKTKKLRTSSTESNSFSINDNDIYLEVVGGKNEKGNVYGLGKLTNKFMHSN